MTTTTQPAAKIGDTAWYLTKILHTEGVCDHCGRQLKHLYEVVNPAGVEMTVGRGCVKKLTGWTVSYAEAQRLLYCVEIDRRRGVVAEAFPELAAAHEAVQKACRQAREEGYDAYAGFVRVDAVTRDRYNIFQAAYTTRHLWEHGERWREYVADCVRY